MLKATLARCLLLASIVLGLSESSRAQDLDTGRTEFLSRCATCHGADGKGDGPHGIKLKTKPPNLTTLAKRNKGVFPQRAVHDAVDGRKTTRSHRISEMPIWGCRHAPPPRVAQKPAGKRIGRDGKTRKLPTRKPRSEIPVFGPCAGGRVVMARDTDLKARTPKGDPISDAEVFDRCKKAVRAKIRASQQELRPHRRRVLIDVVIGDLRDWARKIEGGK